MTSYYNEVDKHAAAWLRELIKAGHIADGIVDERDIQDVLPSDLDGFTQCHFFAGIGVWSYALRNSGWADDRPVWTGSCPCQPFSSAGKGSAFADERHLWPAFHHLIKECRPPVVFGEQVAGSAINPWVDLVHADLEAVGYAFGCVPFPSASVGAPHIRDRLYWVAYATSDRWSRQGAGWAAEEGRQPRSERTGQLSDGLEGHGASVGVADSSGARLDQRQRVAGIPGRKTGADARQTAVGNGVCSVVGMADTNGRQRDGIAVVRGDERDGQDAGRPQGGRGASACGGSFRVGHADGAASQRGAGSVLGAQAAIDCARQHDGREHHGSANAGEGLGFRSGPLHSFWRNADWLLCRDGKWRPVEPGAFPLVDGAAARVVRLRGYGNAINAVQAQAFIEAFMGYRQEVAA